MTAHDAEIKNSAGIMLKRAMIMHSERLSGELEMLQGTIAEAERYVDLRSPNTKYAQSAFNNLRRTVEKLNVKLLSIHLKADDEATRS